MAKAERVKAETWFGKSGAGCDEVSYSMYEPQPLRDSEQVSHHSPSIFQGCLWQCVDVDGERAGCHVIAVGGTGRGWTLEVFSGNTFSRVS